MFYVKTQTYDISVYLCKKTVFKCCVIKKTGVDYAKPTPVVIINELKIKAR